MVSQRHTFEGAYDMGSPFEFDWDMLMSHWYVWDLFLIRLNFWENKETAAD